MYRILLFFALIASLTACKDKPSTANSEAVSNADEIPGLPVEIMQNLWNNCELVDYIFHDLPFSLSQSEGPAIKSNLSFISTEPLGTIDPNCKPIGREFFQVNGEIILEADLYFSEGCFFYVFVENDKPKYANKMSQSGMQFYANIIRQVVSQPSGNAGSH